MRGHASGWLPFNVPFGGFEIFDHRDGEVRRITNAIEAGRRNARRKKGKKR